MSNKILFLYGFFLICCILQSHFVNSASDISPTYFVKDPNTSLVCILLRLKATVRIPFKKADNRVDIALHELNDKAKASGSCGTNGQYITLSWYPNHEKSQASSPDPWNIEFQFEEYENSYALTNVTIDYYLDEELFPGTIETGNRTFVKSIKSETFNTPFNYSYECITESSINFNQFEGLGIDFTDFRFEAFRNSNDTKFSDQATFCKRDRAVNTIVPIVVGSTLALLVGIILIAYFVTRRHNLPGSRGYETI